MSRATRRDFPSLVRVKVAPSRKASWYQPGHLGLSHLSSDHDLDAAHFPEGDLKGDQPRCQLVGGQGFGILVAQLLEEQSFELVEGEAVDAEPVLAGAPSVGLCGLRLPGGGEPVQ